MSTIIIIDPPTVVQKSPEESERAKEQVLKDIEALREAGYKVTVYNPLQR